MYPYGWPAFVTAEEAESVLVAVREYLGKIDRPVLTWVVLENVQDHWARTIRITPGDQTRMIEQALRECGAQEFWVKKENQ
jgi:isopentenyl diphosphate isomerase/L-lactate dehydrogenase-like FMN-dependent dehydrogenase